ncbi:MAG: glycosyltransferase family 4 protein, partial [Methanothrix sp.]|nr:glycosyltransferase family 4 protein [Methanothrix sp.]
MVNARFQTRCVTGVERYAGEILRRMQAQIRQVKPGYRLNGLGGHVWEQFILPLGIKKDEILWSPANTGPILVSNQIITIHDTSFLDHPEWYQPEFVAWYQFVVPRLLHRARVVTTVSSYSKIRILQAFRIYDDKVNVIPGGVDQNWFKPQLESELHRVRRKYNIAEAYILTLGSLQPRKNLPRLLAAWRQVHSRYPHIELIIAGGGGSVFRELEIQEVPSGVRILGYVDDADLPALYAGALAY